MNQIINREDTRLASVNLGIPIKSGEGQFDYPESIRAKLLHVYLIPQSIEVFKTSSKTAFIFSNVSYYQNSDMNIYQNIIQSFSCQNKGLFHFGGSKTINALNFTPSVVNIFIKYFENGEYHLMKDFDGFLILTLFGPRTRIK